MRAATSHPIAPKAYPLQMSSSDEAKAVLHKGA